MSEQTEQTTGLTTEQIESNPNMSPKEKLFAKFFAAEVTLIKDMDDASLHAHIEDLQSIAFEARARLTASDSAARERAAKKKRDKGFAATVNVDSDFTSNAINNINERKKKMSKVEKEVERLVGLGISREDAENMYRATTVSAIKKGHIDAVVKDVNREPTSQNTINAIVDSVVNFTTEQKKDFVNPFAPKIETVESSAPPNVLKEIVDIQVPEETVKSESATVDIELKPKPKFINPFA